MKKFLILLAMGAVVVFTLVFSGSAVYSAIPQTINYQGMLTDGEDDPVTDTVNMDFKIYDAASLGNKLWEESQTNVEVIDGLFNVILGSVNPIDSLSFDQTYWLEVQVGSDILPRLKFTSVAYAFRAQIADTAYNVTSPGPISVDGVSNPGGDIDLVAGSNMSITPNDGANTITFSSTGGVSYAGVWTVAQSGGDFTTINGALGACVNPGSSNPYLIRVMPGIYVESVICSSFVRLQGAGKYVCYITGSVTGADSCTIDGFNIAGGITCPGTSPTITHNLITNEGDGILITTDGGRPWIKENEIIDCEGWGIHCNGWGTDAWIIANKIERNTGGGIRCTDSSPTISNNQILENDNYGIYLAGAEGFPSEPTIDDNVIGRTQPPGAGIGIYMTGYAEPRIIANDIWVNFTGIEIHPFTQPSILANNINYNHGYGIRCFSSGAGSKPVVIKGNHIHSNPAVGLDIVNASPIVTHNNIHNNDLAGINPDIQYVGPPFPMISLNVVDLIGNQLTGAVGLYNVTTLGVGINP